MGHYSTVRGSCKVTVLGSEGGERRSDGNVEGLMIVGLEDVEEVARIAGDVPGPKAEAAVLVDGLDPLGEEVALGFVLLGVKTFNFEDEHATRG